MNSSSEKWVVQRYLDQCGWFAEILDCETYERNWIFINCDTARVSVEQGKFTWQEYEGLPIVQTDHPEEGVDG